MLAQQLAQLLQAALGVRVCGQEQVHGPPHQAHQQVAAALGDHGQADQLAGQLAPERRVLGTEQAVVGQVERLRDGERVPRARASRTSRRIPSCVPFR
ncbi:hypothetical protein [Nonomuraea wenchangensis]|uniref:hypothetical protein n=1 Tax=Nonomuraea wenchangensis TaxID=568860 RepID=UPI0033D8A807